MRLQPEICSRDKNQRHGGQLLLFAALDRSQQKKGINAVEQRLPKDHPFAAVALGSVGNVLLSNPLGQVMVLFFVP